MTRLCDLSSEGNAVTSVAWSERGHLVAVGTQKGHISVWDVAVNKEVAYVVIRKSYIPGPLIVDISLILIQMLPAIK